MAKKQQSRARSSGWIQRWWPGWLICIVAFAATPWLLGPRCPDRIVIATGPTDGAYFAYANEYKKILATHGITLEVRATEGSLENQSLLDADDGTVSLAIMQGGTGDAHSSELESLASLYPEPVWLFSRDEPFNEITQLRGKRIAVGRESSGTRAIALQLLEDSAVRDGDGETRLMNLGPREACEQLKSGEIDAAFIVMSPEAVIIHELLNAKGVRLANLRRVTAWQQKYPFLSVPTLPEGVVDIESNIPDRDIRLLAPTANLVARNDLHHALIPLILQAVQQVHESNGLLVRSTPFPNPQYTDFPVNDDARRYFRSGPSLLFRYLPFWLAAWLDRVKLILLPLCTLLIPFIKAAPPIYRWRIRSKIYRWYRVLHDIDMEIKERGHRVDANRFLSRLSELEQELFEVSVPLSYMEEFYNLRLHVAFVRNKLRQLQDSVDSLRPAA
ncbi:MAG: TAXI family TRAP transporter solute-binding subunit [Pirellulaceae bacterium]